MQAYSVKIGPAPDGTITIAMLDANEKVLCVANCDLAMAFECWRALRMAAEFIGAQDAETRH